MYRFLFVDSNVNYGGSLKGTINLLSSLSQKGYLCKACDFFGINDKYLKELESNDISYTVLLQDSRNYILGKGGVIKRFFKFISHLPDQVKVILGIRRLIKSENYDYVLVNNKKTLLPVAIASIGTKAKIIIYHRVWVQEHDIDLLYLLLMRFFCENIISHAQDSVKTLSKLFPQKKVSYIPNAVELEIEPVHKKNDIFTIILPASRPTKLKGYDCAIKAIKDYSQRYGRDIKLILTGDVPIGHTSDFSEELKNLIKNYEIEDLIEFTGWRNDILDMINSSDLMILPTHTEGFPRVIIESMLLKTPVISTPVGGIPDALVNGITGYLVDVDNYELLSECIFKVKNNREDTLHIIESAYRFSKNKFTLEKQVTSFINALEKA
ncbi:glycosyltransferase family 4 protein [Vibrio natriegens]|uniref:Glycosyl transferase family 1 domain-containing protein n=1 Tax=Vibrio natriegens NBRC 15636 = ATCC 14048 = DSM 759 TaxID=1219067 RepID=A0AAN0Y0J1_VIBNA|nr:glycosyltransferase family 4 protein [Vibrio natriegens]ALR16680.1 hypothetical protein PN96_12135 [Vibrio natriegens NBRC 15636 = ATCC 14048 = DSM 759]ANQ11454.1 hypothetical protein BA890_01195 [Vibrio natriegens NBRC 15636 = ATCC 14048 = DSM 759]EPM39020.1 hypothetical protein M272_18755 [Vibrio natriegens NBRC 15636 = ATCC 14048 = DSM 759]MDX6025785.1 glycosyltransferase family 4 protein [Vibrio natriegens NBRC 15636 = ATCC 14048 = DSM 759]UUI11902.1 glycosyltransferase family 4 protein